MSHGSLIVIEMTEEVKKKSRSWAGALGPDGKPIEESEAATQATADAAQEAQFKAVALHTAIMEKTILDLFKMLEDSNKEVLKTLKGIESEMIKANGMMMVQIDSAAPEVTHEQVERAVKEETKTAPPPAPEVKKDLTKPDNVGNEAGIIEYYKGKLADVKAQTGEAMTQDILNKMVFKFEQDKIIMNTPWVPTPLFAAIAYRIEKVLQCGLYVRGKGSHFELQYP